MVNPAISGEFVEIGLCLTLWFDGKIDQWQPLHEEIIAGDFVVTIQCFSNTTANHFHGNAVPGWWVKLTRESGKDKPFARYYFLSPLLIVKLSARESYIKTCTCKPK